MTRRCFVSGMFAVLATSVLATPAAAEKRVLQQYGTRYTVTVKVYTRSVRQEEGWRRYAGQTAHDFTCEQRAYMTEPCEPYECGRQETWVDCFPHDCTTGGPVRSDGAACHERCLREEPKICYRRQCPIMEDWCKYSRDYWIFADEKTVVAIHDSLVREPPGLPEPSADVRLERAEKFSVGFWDWDAARRAPRATYEYEPASREEFQTFMTQPFGRWLCEITSIGPGKAVIRPLRRVR